MFGAQAGSHLLVWLKPKPQNSALKTLSQKLSRNTKKTSQKLVRGLHDVILQMSSDRASGNDPKPLRLGGFWSYGALGFRDLRGARASGFGFGL